MQINCLLPLPGVKQKADQPSISSQSCKIPDKGWCAPPLPCQARRSPEWCLPSGVPLMSVGGPVLTVRLGFWVRAFCRVQSKLSILSCTKPQIFSSSKRQVLSVGWEGKGPLSCCFSNTHPKLPGCSQKCCVTTEALGQARGRWAARPQEEAAKEGITELTEITEWVELEAASKFIQAQTHCHGQGCHSLDQVAYGPIQPDHQQFHR